MRPQLRVHALTTGHVIVRQGQVQGVGTGNARRLNVLRDKHWTEPLPIHAWAIEHPEGLIVVDTGEVSAGSDPRHYPALNPYLRRATRFQITRQDEIDTQLRQGVGLPVDQVRTSLPVGPQLPGNTAGPTFDFYRTGYLLPHQHAAGLLLHERATELASSCSDLAAQTGDETLANVEGTLRALVGLLAGSL